MTILEFVRYELSDQEIKLGTKFDELGLDSLDFLDLIQQVEKEFSVKIPDSEFKNLVKVGDLIAYISAGNV